MIELPDDLVDLILNEVRLSSPNDLNSTTTVNRRLAELSKRHIFYSCRIKSGTDLSEAIYERLNDDPKVRVLVKELDVEEYCESPWREEGQAPPFTIKHIINMSRVDSPIQLQVFRYAGPDLGTEVLEEFMKLHPQCLIYLDKYGGGVIPRMPNLLALKALVHIRQNPVRAFQPVLRNSLNLKSLTIAAFRQSGCVVQSFRSPPFLKEPDFHGENPKDEYPLLESLIIQDFYSGGESLQWLDLTRLHTLELNKGSMLGFLNTITPVVNTMLPNLRSFALRSWYQYETLQVEEYRRAVIAFFESTHKGLEEITLEGPCDTLLGVIGRSHGHTLRNLSLHDPEHASEGTQRSTPSSVHVQELVRVCGQLESLELDVDQIHADLTTKNSAVSFEFLAGLLTDKGYLPHLQCLQLHTLLGVSECKVRFSWEGAKTVAPWMLPCAARMKQGVRIMVGENGRTMGIGLPGSCILWESTEHRSFSFRRLSSTQVKLTEDRMPCPAYGTSSTVYTLQDGTGGWAKGKDDYHEIKEEDL